MIVGTLLAAMIGGLSPQTVLPPRQMVRQQQQQLKQQNSTKVSPTRVSPSNNFRRFLTPVTKQTFKQNRRKELAKSSKRKNKR